MPEEQKKESYQIELRTRVVQFLEGDDFEGMPPRDADVSALYEFVRGIALQSFKNGVTVGKRRGRAKLDEPRGSGKVKR